MTTTAVPQAAPSAPEKRRKVSVKTIAAGVAAGVIAAAGVLGAGRAGGEPKQQAQPAISAPVLTAEDVAALRAVPGDVAQMSRDLRELEKHVAGIDGYLKAKAEAEAKAGH